jgi:hypothetical protein
MDSNQARIIDLLREVHLIAFKEIERLNMRIGELENQHRLPAEKPTAKPAVKEPPAVHPANATPPLPTQSEMLNEHQVAGYVRMNA